MVSCVVVSLHIALAALRRPLGNANPFLGERAREGRSTVRVEAAERGEPQIEQKGQGETGVNSNEPNLAEGEEGRERGKGGIGIANSPSAAAAENLHQPLSEDEIL